MDYRYIYFLRDRGGKISCLMAIRVPYASKRERKLHAMFFDSRYTRKRKRVLAPNGIFSMFEARCKIGIATDLPRRVGTIQADKLSGKTEWFTLTIWERWAVRYWLAKWWLKKWAILVFVISILIYLASFI